MRPAIEVLRVSLLRLASFDCLPESLLGRVPQVSNKNDSQCAL